MKAYFFGTVGHFDKLAVTEMTVTMTSLPGHVLSQK